MALIRIAPNHPLKLLVIIILSNAITLTMYTFFMLDFDDPAAIDDFGWSEYQSPQPASHELKIDIKNQKFDITDQKSYSDLNRQKHRFEIARSIRVQAMRSAATSNRLHSLQMYVVPQVACPTMVRVGKLGDGGKWVCNPWRVPEIGCVIYSLGVNGDTTFEQDLYYASERRCKFYCVDPGEQDPELFLPFNGVFHRAYITGKTDKKNISLADMMKMFEHTKVDILKMDIEGSEFEALTSFFSTNNINAKKSSICQLLVEFHIDKKIDRLETWLKMFELLERKGFRMFSKEANMYCPHCFEYSYIHLSCFEKYGLDEKNVYFTYFL